MLKITLTIEATDIKGVTTNLTKTAEYSGGNALYYADAVRNLGGSLNDELADKLDVLYPQGDRPVGPPTI